MKFATVAIACLLFHPTRGQAADPAEYKPTNGMYTMTVHFESATRWLVG